MTPVFQQRCALHLEREAVALCRECRRSFCRECVVEHRDRVLCAECLLKVERHEPSPQILWRRLGRVAIAGAGLMLLWLVFFSLGSILVRIPSAVHEGTALFPETSDTP